MYFWDRTYLPNFFIIFYIFDCIKIIFLRKFIYLIIYQISQQKQTQTLSINIKYKI